ncbi:MAG: pyrroloquinoline quinone-dependent dehydrogenase [Chromatiales bacterium]|nr:MAG: pyrroloquinoline quinone-dependent dehydrogenase [Chromatiales bacterium]
MICRSARFFFAIGLSLAGATPAPGGDTDWLHYGGDAGGAHHSTLSQINRDNVTRLELAWSFQTGATSRHPERAGFATFHATPLKLPGNAGGALVFCTPYNRIIALEPETGAPRWTYDSELDLGPMGTRYNCRGIAYWEDPMAEPGAACRHRLFMGTGDLRLVAIDAITGAACPGFGDSGEVDIRRMVQAEVAAKAKTLGRPADLRHGDLQFSSPPAVIGSTVIVGSSNNTKFRRDDGPSGAVRAFDARTGAPRWSFDPVPRNPGDPQAANWAPTALQTVGAANVWSMMSVDTERELVFLPTASASPDFYGAGRPGDNRYANSVVALHGRTGKVAWHFQIVHHDVWDLDLPAQPILVEIDKGDQRIPVVVQLTKQGMIYVLHRDTGEPVFPVEERPVPTDGVPGEELSPTQPYPTAPPLLVEHSLSPDDAFGFTFVDRNACRRMIASRRHDHYYAPPVPEGTAMFPGMSVNNWGGGGFYPAGNLLVVPINRAAMSRGLIPLDELDPAQLERAGKGPPLGVPVVIEGTPYAQFMQPLLSPMFSPCNAPPWGELAAVDLAAGEIAWRRVFGVLDKLMPVPIPLEWGTPNAGGPIVTDSGLIFIGATMDERFRAFDVMTGEQLWEASTPTAAMATPMTYMAGGRQFIVVAAGGHMWQYPFKPGDWLLAYALP